MSDYIFGANILESLTNGMYQDSRMVLREYIQNSCDAIDAAIRAGILGTDDGKIYITMDAEGRNITIEDNGTGIKAGDFERVMGHIADSEKKQSENKGFRGIGRLCGMAYCRTVRFTAKYQGEDVVSVLTCEAKTMRELIAENTEKKYTAQEVLSLINEFKTEKTEDIDAHYFRVELEGISTSNQYLLDYEKVKEFLSFTAPLPYGVAFAMFRKRIHEHAEGLGLKIDEYNIFLNDEQLFKPYTYRFSTKLGEDEVFDIEFEDFRDDDGNVMAWLWFGVSRFRGAIKKEHSMRGIRLRIKNIQLGDENALQKLFIEDRGINYFVGELFCVSDGLIVNAQRNYFIENLTRSEFEEQIKNYFKELKRIYYDSSRVSSLYRRIKTAEDKEEEFEFMLKFGDSSRVSKTMNELQETKNISAKAEEEISKIKAARGHIMNKVIKRIAERYNDEEQDAEATSERRRRYPQEYSRRERLLLYNIAEIITKTADRETADKIITAIKTDLIQSPHFSFTPQQ